MNMPDPTIIERVLENKATEGESREVAHWFRTPEGQAWLSKRMDQDERAINLGDEEAWIDHRVPSREMYEAIMLRLRRRRIRRWMMYAAAVLLPVALMVGLFMRLDLREDSLFDKNYKEINVPYGERKRVLLPDGSEVYLNAGSVMRYPQKFESSVRKVYLEGEAWFEVASHEAWPFVVDISCMEIKVLGTSFDVIAYPEEDSVLIFLETGSVELTSDSLRAYSLRSGEKAVYNKISDSCSVSPVPNVSMRSAWRNHVLVFEKTSLSEVIKTLTRTFNIVFKVKEPAALRYTYTITFDHMDLESILTDLEMISPVRFEEKERYVEVSLRK